MMIDKMQAQMFSSLGQTRSLFQGVAEWPSLDQALRERSQVFLKKSGKDRWAAAGGVYGPDGKPTCLPTSQLATGMVRDLAVDPGGLLWTDRDGIAWAVRLMPADRDGHAFFGIALSWNGVGPVVEKTSAPPRQSKGKEAKDFRRSLAQQAQRLRLATRAEQLLWAIHWAVLTQRRSVVLLPDILLGQVVWGGNSRQWPQDWRRDLFPTLRSLTHLRLEVLRLAAEGWRPQLGLHSVAVATVEQMWVSRPEEDYCRDYCPMWGTAQPHRHFLIQAGYGFLGAMEKFATEDRPECRTYHFRRRPTTDRGKDLQEAQKAGQLVSVNGPAAIFGRSRWSGLSEGSVRILRALAREVTRPLPPGKSKRPDAAFVLKGDKVPGHTPKARIVCPLLERKGRYVAFCGNGLRWGMGYRIVGVQGTGWLAKCGYELAKNGDGLGRVVCSFLADLQEVSEALGLIVAGLGSSASEWLDVRQLVTLAQSQAGVEQLLSVHLRVYGPEDYLERWRTYFAEKGGFTSIPGGEEDAQPVAPSGLSDLSTRIRLAGIRQVDLARHLGVSQPYICQLLSPRRQGAWPEWARRRAEAFLKKRTRSRSGRDVSK